MRLMPILLMTLVVGCVAGESIQPKMIRDVDMPPATSTDPREPGDPIPTPTDELASVLGASISTPTATTPTSPNTPAVATAAPAAPSPEAPKPTPAPGAESFLQGINAERTAVGLGALVRDGGLDSYAASWAKRMATSGELSHSNISSLLGSFSVIGENVGYGSSVAQIQTAFVSSSRHYQNMVNPSFRVVGIGVFVDSQGTIWTCQVFAG